MKRKNFVWVYSFILLGMFLAPDSLFAYHSKNYYLDAANEDSMCNHCHPPPGGPHAYRPRCAECHDDPNDPVCIPDDDPNDPDCEHEFQNHPEYLGVAPAMKNHSNVNLGTAYDHMDTWNLARPHAGVSDPFPLTCINCHHQHRNNGITRLDGVTNTDYLLVSFDGLCTAQNSETGVTTMDISDLVIHDQAWADPDTWGAKTTADRGLVLLNTIGDDTTGYSTLWYKVLSATDTTITFLSDHTFYKSGEQATLYENMQLVYGQLIRDEVGKFPGTFDGGTRLVDGTAITFGGPSDMANDESGTGIDPTPDGICQVCHTQTTHWTSDGLWTNHFSGWRCTLCHPHEQGFKADPPLLCP